MPCEQKIEAIYAPYELGKGQNIIPQVQIICIKYHFEPNALIRTKYKFFLHENCKFLKIYSKITAIYNLLKKWVTFSGEVSIGTIYNINYV